MLLVPLYNLTERPEMEPREKLRVWMDENGYSNKTLAEAMGFSYEYIYKIIEGKDGKRPGVNFQIRFVERFGWDEAAKALDLTLPVRDVEPA